MWKNKRGIGSGGGDEGEGRKRIQKVTEAKLVIGDSFWDWNDNLHKKKPHTTVLFKHLAGF